MSTDPLTFASSHLEKTEYEAFEVGVLTELCRHWIHSIESLGAKQMMQRKFSIYKDLSVLLNQVTTL